MNLIERVKNLRLHGLLKYWEELRDEPLLAKLIDYEERERGERSLKSRQVSARLGTFKPMCEYDWTWPKKINRGQIEDLFSLKFLSEKENVIFMGPHGIGKTMTMKNLAYQAVVAGHTVRFVTASEMLNDLSSQDGSTALNRRMKFYASPSLLAIDEIGYLSYSTRQADLLFEIVSRRYEQKSILLSTNLAFHQWNQAFGVTASVVALLDRLVHKAEIVNIEGDSWRTKESLERLESRKNTRESRRNKKACPPRS